jgi:rhodanese-related sulfurtransferase
MHDRRDVRDAVSIAVLCEVAEVAAFPGDRDIVFYCACPNEESSKRAAQILLAKGFTRARPLIGGIDAWLAMGGDVDHGMPMTFVRGAAAPDGAR